MNKLKLLAIGLAVSMACNAQEEMSEENSTKDKDTRGEVSTEDLTKDKKWQIEPIKLTSLMVNTHSEYNGWGFEVGRKITDKIWVTSMIEKTKGADFLKNFDPNYDFLISFNYFAWLTTARYYFKPDARFTTFFDAGIELQTASHKFLRGNQVYMEKALSMGPIAFVGCEWRLGKNMYFKWRMGGFLNVFKSGSMKSRINDGQDQPPFYLYPHLSDAVIRDGNYAGDAAIGIRF